MGLSYFQIFHSSLTFDILSPHQLLHISSRVKSTVKNGQFSKLATSLVWRAIVQIKPVQKLIAEKQWDLSKL